MRNNMLFYHQNNHAHTKPKIVGGCDSVTAYNTVNDEIDELVIYGDSYQKVTEQSVNLFDEVNILPEQGWTLQDDGSYYASSPPNFCNMVLWENTENYTGQVLVKTNTRYTTATGDRGALTQINYTDGTTIKSNQQGVTLEWQDIYTISDATKTVDTVTWTYGAVVPTYVKDIMIAKSSVEVDYEPFVADSPSPEYPSNIVSVEGELTSNSVNLFDEATILPSQGWTLQEDKSYYVGSGMTPYGKVIWQNDSQNLYTGQLYVQYEAKIVANTVNSGAMITIIYTDGTLDKIYNGWETWRTFFKITNAQKIINKIIWDAGSSNPTYIKNVMIAKSNTAIPYQKYKQPKSIDIPSLYGIGSCKDELHIDRVEKRAWIERKIDNALLVNTEKLEEQTSAILDLPTIEELDYNNLPTYYNRTILEYNGNLSPEMIVKLKVYKENDVAELL